MQSQPTVDRREFRNALGTFTTGVTIITAVGADGTRVGITANSFNSVSLEPPMVLWSLAKTARSLPVFSAAEHWAVHILSATQEALSDRFARTGQDKFAGLEVSPGIAGIPLLEGCAARLQCKTSFRYEGGDHVIFVGEVLALERCDAPPLVFQGGRYALAARRESASLAEVPEGDPEASFGEDFLGYLLTRAHFQFLAYVRGLLERKGLTELEYFVLTVLNIRDGGTIEQLNARYAYTGYLATSRLAARLAERGMVNLEGSGDQTLCTLTPAGRDLALHLTAAVKAFESDLLGRFGDWDAVVLKNLLKRLILQTKPAVLAKA
jgi:3-hydroxy-9,10-secoandrosta-1,3,5(10)-triene-9,17-dione monooxygenase reductase component